MLFMSLVLPLAAAYGIASGVPASAPPIGEKASYARWMTANHTWGVMSTTSTMKAIAGTPFGNPVAYADDGSGTPVFCVSGLDQSIVDLEVDNRMSLTLSRAADGDVKACQPAVGEAENPPCARLVLSGTFAKLEADEQPAAISALNKTHPAMASWGCWGENSGPSGHDFYLAKLAVAQAWLINMYGGAAVIMSDEYANATIAFI